jgi:hypothetical protein
MSTLKSVVDRLIGLWVELWVMGYELWGLTIHDIG